MGAWSPIPHPYGKYIYEDPNAYTAVDPALIKNALAGSGLSSDNTDALFSSWQSGMGLGGSTTPTTNPDPTAAPIDYKSLIENDPAYIQARADASAGGVADASSRAAALKKLLIDWGLIPDFATAGDKLGLSPATLGFLSTDVDQHARDLAAANEAQGLSLHAKLDKANQDNINAMRNALAARGMYQSGELGYGLEQNAQQFKQASTDAEKQVLGQVENVSGQYVQGEQGRQRDLANSMSSAADRALQQVGSSGANTSGSTTNGVTSGTSRFLMPANTATVWDVNTASTMDAINAAKQSGGGIVIRPDDPESITKANAAAEAGVPVSIQVNGSATDTPETLTARITQYQKQYPGASFTLDLESPNFRGGPGTPGYTAMTQYAQQVAQAAGTTPITITTEGVSDFNYGAWANNPNVTFAPQAYNGDMSPRNVQQVVSLLTSQGIDPSRIIPVVAPGQDLGGYTGKVSVYGAPAGAPVPTPTAPSSPSTGPAPSYASPAPTKGIDNVYRVNKFLGLE